MQERIKKSSCNRGQPKKKNARGERGKGMRGQPQFNITERTANGQKAKEDS